MKAWFARAWAWLATHPWPIVVALASALVLILFRRRPTPGVAELKIARDSARAEVKRQEADKLEPQIAKERVEIAKTEEHLRQMETPKEDIRNAPDNDVADVFTRSGL